MNNIEREKFQKLFNKVFELDKELKNIGYDSIAIMDIFTIIFDINNDNIRSDFKRMKNEI